MNFPTLRAHYLLLFVTPLVIAAANKKVETLMRGESGNIQQKNAVGMNNR